MENRYSCKRTKLFKKSKANHNVAPKTAYHLTVVKELSYLKNRKQITTVTPATNKANRL